MLYTSSFNHGHCTIYLFYYEIVQGVQEKKIKQHKKVACEKVVCEI